MAEPVRKVEAPIGYDEDFYLWCMEQADRLRFGASEMAGSNALDWTNPAEEIESLGRSNCSQIRNRLARLVQHLRKWSYQPDRRTYRRRLTMQNRRDGLAAVIEDSPSLGRRPEEVFEWSYRQGRNKALLETELPEGVVPDEPSSTLDRVLATGWMPDVARQTMSDRDVGEP